MQLTLASLTLLLAGMASANVIKVVEDKNVYYDVQVGPQGTQTIIRTKIEYHTQNKAPAAPAATTTVSPQAHDKKVVVVTKVVQKAAATQAPAAAAPPAQTTSTSTTASATGTGSSNGATDDNDYSNKSLFKSNMLAEHNAKRALHGVNALKWDSDLESYAQAYADKQDCSSLIHSHGPYGENLAAGYKNAKANVDAWYNEINQFNFNNPGYSESTGHFTQVIWKDTSLLGCAVKQCSTGFKSFVICSYKSAGNVLGQNWKEKVPKKV